MPIKNINDIIKNINIPVVIACSGGPDSVFLAHILKKSNQNIIHHLVYCNHHLRPNETKNELVFIKKLAKTLNFKSKVISLSINKENQDEFRQERLNQLVDYAKNNNIKDIILGHHFNDDLETLIMQLLRGASTNLRGIPHETSFKGVLLKHPLLNLSKREILAYLENNKIEFLNDSSNQSFKYERNRIRHTIQKIEEEPQFKPRQTVKSINYLKENEIRLRNKANHLKAELISINNLFLLNKNFVLQLEESTVILKILIETYFNSPINQTEMNQLSSGLITSHLTTIILREWIIEMDYKWISFKKKNEKHSLIYKKYLTHTGSQHFSTGSLCITPWINEQSSSNALLALSKDELQQLKVTTVTDSPIQIKGLKKKFRSAEVSPIEQTIYPAFTIGNKLVWIPYVYSTRKKGDIIISYKKNFKKSFRSSSLEL